MHAADDRPEFAPPPQPGLLRGFALAVLAHLLLLLMLTQGLRWQRETQDASVEAELWSSVPVEAAPKPVPPPPAPPPAPPPEPPKPVVKAPPQPDPQALRDAQIALEREKAKKREEEERKQAELQREREERRKAEAKKKHEEELARQKLEEKRVAEARRKEAEEKKRKDAEEKKRREQQQREEREAKLREQIRKDTMSRMQDMAGTGGAGTAARAAGPSKSWAGRVIARVRPNIVYTELPTGNPEAVVEVRMAPDGTIVGKRLKKSSGNRSWDDAVLRALEKTEVLPRDPETGRVPSSAELVFRPKD